MSDRFAVGDLVRIWYDDVRYSEIILVVKIHTEYHIEGFSPECGIYPIYLSYYHCEKIS